MRTAWEARAKEVEEIYNGYVDWDERFFICPECGDAVAECDWPEEEFHNFICPICGMGWSDEEEEEEGKEKFEVIIRIAYTVSAKSPRQAKEFASEMFMNHVNCNNFDIHVNIIE